MVAPLAHHDCCVLESVLLNHPGRNEIMHPVLLVALLAQMRRELGPVPDAMGQCMNKDLSAAGREIAGRARGET
jgi:hypothetical protein